MSQDPTRFDLQLGLELAGASIGDLWWRYAAFGGEADPELLADIIAGRVTCVARDLNRIAQALNEVFLERGIDTFPVGYVDDIDTAVAARIAPSVGRFAPDDEPGRVRFEARAAARRSRVISRETKRLREMADVLIGTSRQLTDTRQARRADVARRRERIDALRQLNA